jgi:hypothetical protein
MSTGTTAQYTLTLNEAERTVLLDILEDVWKTTQVEEHRTDRFGAKAVVQAREAAIGSLLQKTQAARPA